MFANRARRFRVLVSSCRCASRLADHLVYERQFADHRVRDVEWVKRILTHGGVHPIEAQRQPLPVLQQPLDGGVLIGRERNDVPLNRESDPVGMQDQSGLPGSVNGAGDVQVVGEALGKILPGCIVAYSEM